MVDQKNKSIVEKDFEGNVRFNPKFRNEFDLMDALERLSESELNNVDFEKEVVTIGNIYEKVFNHRNFTGRSGTMFSYEGIGSIYWHMVSKLLLATQENYFFAKKQNLADHTRSWKLLL